MQLSNEVIEFLKKEIFPKIQIDSINDDNSYIVVNFINDYYETPLAQAEEAGNSIDKNLLRIATLAVTQITKNW